MFSIVRDKQWYAKGRIESRLKHIPREMQRATTATRREAANRIVLACDVAATRAAARCSGGCRGGGGRGLQWRQPRKRPRRAAVRCSERQRWKWQQRAVVDVAGSRLLF